MTDLDSTVSSQEKKRKDRAAYMKMWRAKNKDHSKAYMLSYLREWRKKNREKDLAIGRRYKKKNADKVQQGRVLYRKKYQDKINERMREWKRSNPDHDRRCNAKRRAAFMQRVPSWADFEKIKQVYFQCEEHNARIGIKHHVDHIIPLQGKTVSGLHVHNNLQVITARENAVKLNKFYEKLL